MFIHPTEREDARHDLEDPRPAPADPVAPDPFEPLVPLAMIPGGMWDQVGWWDQVYRNVMDRAILRGLEPGGPGFEIRQRRSAVGMSQASLARRIGVTQPFVWMMEFGVRPIPRRLAPLIDLALDGVLEDKAA